MGVWWCDGRKEKHDGRIRSQAVVGQVKVWTSVMQERGRYSSPSSTCASLCEVSMSSSPACYFKCCHLYTSSSTTTLFQSCLPSTVMLEDSRRQPTPDQQGWRELQARHTLRCRGSCLYWMPPESWKSKHESGDLTRCSDLVDCRTCCAHEPRSERAQQLTHPVASDRLQFYDQRISASAFAEDEMGCTVCPLLSLVAVGRDGLIYASSATEERRFCR